MNLHFSNGQYVSVAAQGKFDVFKPQVSWNAAITGSVAVDGNFQFPAVHLGVPPPNGITFNFELYTPTIARLVPMKNERWNGFSATNATQGSKARLHQTEPPNAMPASWRCPGQPTDVVGNFFQLSTSGSPSVMAATIPALLILC
ncbi:MAG TPA: hypothetical protein VHY30_02150 [Verrucomicrobiae bacterium]|jgi:hypothetical protein|nr:hypothetical protein [Verrucomicrobiae bacterium]